MFICSNPYVNEGAYYIQNSDLEKLPLLSLATNAIKNYYTRPLFLLNVCKENMTTPTTESLPFSAERKFIEDLITQQKPVALYLANGIRLQGYVIGYDKYTVLFKSDNGDNGNTQLIYKHAISTLAPSNGVKSLQRVSRSEEDKMMV